MTIIDLMHLWTTGKQCFIFSNTTNTDATYRLILSFETISVGAKDPWQKKKKSEKKLHIFVTFEGPIKNWYTKVEQKKFVNAWEI